MLAIAANLLWMSDTPRDRIKFRLAIEKPRNPGPAGARRIPRRPPPHQELTCLKSLELPNVMLCAVSSVAIEQTIAALERSSLHIAFGDIVLLTDAEPQLQTGSAVRWVPIAPLRSKEAYSHFMIKELGRHATRPFVLVVQWDGYVLDHARWNPAFLDYDYIGAVWPQFGDGMTMGNGGFSLRSRRLLDLLAGDMFSPMHPEDTAICRTWRPQLEAEFGIRFADEVLASAFSAERFGDLRAAFGFHGFFNLPDVLPIAEVKQMVHALPDRALHGIDGADFILRVGTRGHRRFAWRLLARRLRSSDWGWKQVRLVWALARCTLFRPRSVTGKGNGHIDA